MRGNVYRLGRRRAGSIVLALGAALTLTLGGASAAGAKPTTSHAPVKASKTTHTVAHAAGHKIG